LSETAPSTGARLSGCQSRVAAMCHDAASRTCHARSPAIKDARGSWSGAAQLSEAAYTVIIV
jgi:hypothetical protein